MRPEDQDALSDFIAEFFDGCGIEPPFFFVAIASNGSVVITQFSDIGEQQDVCERVIEPGFALPIVLTVISLDGRGASARIVNDDLGMRLMQ